MSQGFWQDLSPRVFKEGRLSWSLQSNGHGRELLGSKVLALCVCVFSSKAGESWSDKFCRKDKVTQGNKIWESFWGRVLKKSINLGVMWSRWMGNDDSVFLSVQDPKDTQWNLWSGKTNKSIFCRNAYELLDSGTHCHWASQMSTKNRCKTKLGNTGLWVAETRWPEWISGQAQYGSFNTLGKKVMLPKAWNGTCCIAVFFCLNCVLRWSSELSEFHSWHTGQKNCRRAILSSEIEALCKRGLLSAESRKKMSGKGTDSGVLKHATWFFYFETAFCLDFSFFILYYFFCCNVILILKSQSQNRMFQFPL